MIPKTNGYSLEQKTVHYEDTNDATKFALDVRRFHLDPKSADVEKIDANVVDGVLEVTFQKKKPVYVAVANGPRRIKITTKKTATTIGNDDDDVVNVDKNRNEKESEEAKKDHHEDDDSKEYNNKEDSTIAVPTTSPSNSKNDNTKAIATNEKAKDG